MIKRNTRRCRECALKPNYFGKIYRTYYNIIKRQASRRDILFDVSIEYCNEIFIKQEGRCSLSGLHLSFSEKNDNRTGNASLDRIDSFKGYVIDNIQWIDKNINWMKNSFDQDYFIEMCRKVSIYHGENK